MRLILCAEGPYEPQAALTHYLKSQPPTTQDPVHLLFGMRRTPPELPFEPSPYFTIGTFVPGRGLKGLEPLTYHRQSYSQICQALASGSLRPDVVIACATAPDSRGRRSLGVIVSYLDLAVRQAGALVVEEVPWLPTIGGAGFLRTPDDVISTESDQGEPPVHFSAAFDAVDEQIATNVASLLPDNPRLAAGIGRIPDALAVALAGRGDVEVLTGVVTDSTRRMSESGALGHAAIRSMSVVGPQSLLEWSAVPGRVQLSSSTLIHDPSWLARQERFVCVLGALQVDEHGSVNSERIGERAISGLGGAPDFALGAHDSPGGLSIVALRSRDARGRSTLVDRVHTVSLDAGIVDAVVTEHGVAELAGRDPDVRTAALRKIF